jgi:Protein of unknown function (DUF5661)
VTVETLLLTRLHSNPRRTRIEFRRGLEVELEHGAHDPVTNVTKDDSLVTGRIAWTHLKELRDY